jgi:hypothetical protein
MEREIASRRFPTFVRPTVGSASRMTHRARFRARSVAGLVVNVPLGGDVVAAAEAVDAAGGGTVALGAGTYHVSTSIPVSSNVTIQGLGAATIIQAPPTPHAFSLIDNASEGISNIVIQNLVLDGNIPLGAYGSGVYAGAGIYFYALGNPISGLTIQNVEIKNTGIGIYLNSTSNVDIAYSYIHDNNPGNFAHNAYFVGCDDVTVSHSRFDNAHAGDGLHFDFGASGYLIEKSEFSGNRGEGILDQGDTNNVIVDTLTSYNSDNGIYSSDSGRLVSRIVASDNGNVGFYGLGGSGTYNGIAGFANTAGFSTIYGLGGYGVTASNELSATVPNVYLAILANGPLGVADTADWSTAYPGYSSIGEVDFNANHLTNGLLTFNVGAVGSGNYSATMRYSNGTPTTLAMPLAVNGVAIGSVAFPPTGSWTTWSTKVITLPLKDGNNTVAVAAQAAGAPELDYLQVNAAVPAPPLVPRVSATATGPYSVKLTWPAVAHAQSYSVFRSGVSAPLATGLTSSNFTDSTILVGNTTNTYTVAAVNAGGASASSAAVTVTTPLDAPAGFTVSVVTNGYALNWIAANGASTYRIRRATNSGGPYTVIATVPASATSYTDSTANPNEIYYYEIYASNAAGNSANSYQLSVNTPSAGQISEDIGTLGVAGLTDYNASTGVFGLDGAGTGIYYNADSFHYEYLPVTGDVTVTARVVSLQALVPSTQAGIDLRASLAPGDADVLVDLTGGLGATAIIRSTAGTTAGVAGVLPGIKPPYYLQLTRAGNTVTSSVSPDGITWTTISSATIAMPTAAYIGLAVSSTIANKNAFATFDTVSTVGTITPSWSARRNAQLKRRFNLVGRRS